MKTVIGILLLGFLLSACTSQESTISISSRETPQEGLNLFNISEEYGVIEGAYIEGEYRVDFEARRQGLRPFLAYIMEPEIGFYDVSACYISKEGDPFIVMDSCSIPPLCLPTEDQESENCQIDTQTRNKEFQLAQQAAKEMKNLSLPKSLEREVEVITSVENILTDSISEISQAQVNSDPASSNPNN